MTKKITQSGLMTEGQRKQIRRFLEDSISSIDLEALGFSKEEAQEIIEKGDVLQNSIKQFVFEQFKKLAIIDQRFGAALAQFDLTVPMDYNHDTQIDAFHNAVKKLKTTYYYNDALTSKNFAKATNKLTPGKVYTVKIFPILESVTSEDCMNFLKKQRAVLVGGQGLTLAQSLHPDQFPEGRWTVSFDEKETLWKDSGGNHGVPYVFRFSDGDWKFSLGNFESVWDSGNCLVCFCDK